MTEFDPKRLERLGAGLRAFQDAQEEKPQDRDAIADESWAARGYRMIAHLVASVIVGALMGLGLDTLFGTKPIFLIAFVFLGFATGVKLIREDVQKYMQASLAETSTAAESEDEMKEGAKE